MDAPGSSAALEQMMADTPGCGSVMATLRMVTDPVLVTLKVYVMVSPSDTVELPSASLVRLTDLTSSMRFTWGTGRTTVSSGEATVIPAGLTAVA